MRKIFVNICEQALGIKTPKPYLKAYKDLFDTDNIYTYIYYVGEQNSTEQYEFLSTIACKNEEELKGNISKMYQEHKVIFINTFTEGLIELTNSIKKNLGENITEKHESFRDKSLQRKHLQNYNPNLGIKYINTSFESIDEQSIKDYLGYPYIVKPSAGIQSAGVSIIKSKDNLDSYKQEYEKFLEKFKARGFESSSLVFEEFIDGIMYSVDYFVNQEGGITSSLPVHVGLGENIEIDDFMNFVRSFREKTISDVQQNSLDDLIQGSVNALGIKNTFIHHEFKLTSKGNLKTIEINGRIGGYRLEMLQEAFNFNWLSAVTGNTPKRKIGNNFSSFLVYPEKKCILKGFNNDLFSKIALLESVYFINKIESFIGKQIGLTSQGFTKVAIIKIKNHNSQKFEEDYKFIEDNYKNLLTSE